MDNTDLRALILGAMKAAYEAGHHATVEGHYHEEWPDDHVDDWMDDEGIADPGYVRVPVEQLRKLTGLVDIIEGANGAICHGTWRDAKGFRLKDTAEWAAYFCATKETPND